MQCTVIVNSILEPLNPYELVGAYKLRCDVEGVAPLYSVLSQLEVRLLAAHISVFGNSLSIFDIRMLGVRCSHSRVILCLLLFVANFIFRCRDPAETASY